MIEFYSVFVIAKTLTFFGLQTRTKTPTRIVREFTGVRVTLCGTEIALHTV